MNLSIIIPVFNEEQTIAEVLHSLYNLSFPCAREVLVVNDGSTDRTGTILQSLKKKHPLRVFTLAANSGKGSAVRHGLQHAIGDYVIVQDADLELNPEDIVCLWDTAIQKQAPVVYGSRFKKRGGSTVPWITVVANKLMTAYANVLFGSSLSDMATGYKLIRRDVLERILLESTGFEFEPEITAKLLKLGYTIHEVPVRYTPRTYKEGKKISWRDGIVYMKTLSKYRLLKKETFLRV